MISIAEVKRLAGESGVEPRVVDIDYVLGCYLCFLGSQATVKESWLFKGGTALRKCYFEDYRFSEDIDFTLLSKLSVQDLHNILNSTNIALQDAIGIRTDVREIMVDIIEDEYGKESYEARVYYQGPWNYGGSPRLIRIHVNRDERVVFPINNLSVIHQYSDKEELQRAALNVYSLEEIMVEKLRAFSGQRKQSIPHDIFDLHQLSRKVINIEEVIKAFPEKCLAKGVFHDAINLEKVITRKAEYKTNWQNNLEYLVPKVLKVPFEMAWQTSVQLLEKLAKQVL